MKRARESAAHNSWAQQRIGWRIDRHTVTGIRISEIWKAHPQWSARRVIQQLRAAHAVRIQWVQRILHDCWRAAAHSKAAASRSAEV